MKNHLTVEPPSYGSAGGSVTSVASHQDNEEDDEQENNNGNPFESVENETDLDISCSPVPNGNLLIKKY